MNINDRNPQGNNNSPKKLLKFPGIKNKSHEDSQFVNEDGFAQSVIFQQSNFWSRAIVWGIIGITGGLVIWSSFATIDEAVPAQGQLEPEVAVKDVRVPIGGVVREVHVKEGDKVKKGDLLVSLESKIPESQLISLRKIKESLEAENRFYRSQMGQANPNGNSAASNVKINPEVLSLTKSRSAYLQEIRVSQAELNKDLNNAALTPEQRQRVASSSAEFESRQQGSALEIGQIEQQIRGNLVRAKSLTDDISIINQRIRELNNQNQAQIDQKNNQLSQADDQLAQLDKQMAENRARSSAAQEILKTNSGILEKIKPASQQGAISQVQVLRQEQEVTTRRSEVEQLAQQYARLQAQKNEISNRKNQFNSEKNEITARGKIEINNLMQQIQQKQNEIRQLAEDNRRFELGKNQGGTKIINNSSNRSKEILSKISDYQNRVAEIDTQLNKLIVENEKKIAEIDGQINQANVNLNYQEIRSPANGSVFELKAFNTGVVGNTTNEPVLKIVPDDSLVAKVYITNKDIGFVKNDMKVDVRIDSFPFSEFGDIKGTLVSIGSDALPPDQAHPFYRFPAKIKLDRQTMKVKDREVPLQAGMSLNANIKLRNRTVMSIFTDMFTKQTDNIKTVR